MPYKNKHDKLAQQRRHYADHREDQLRKILANRRKSKQRDKVNAATLPDWKTYASYRAYCRSVGVKPQTCDDWLTSRGDHTEPVSP